MRFKYLIALAAVVAAALTVGLITASPAQAATNSCTTYSDIFNYYTVNRTVGIQMKIVCTSYGGLPTIRGQNGQVAIACLRQQNVQGQEWFLVQCWNAPQTSGGTSAQGGGFVSCPTAIGTFNYDGLAYWDVRWPSGYHVIYQPLTRTISDPCLAV